MGRNRSRHATECRIGMPEYDGSSTSRFLIRPRNAWCQIVAPNGADPVGMRCSWKFGRDVRTSRPLRSSIDSSADLERRLRAEPVTTRRGVISVFSFALRQF